jgi:alpha-amylase/alpha-mannosidase (GH57 family)
VVIHGHFYQPPREDPWLETVEREPSAAPAHDWNERIEQECYRAVVAARRHTADGRIGAIVNTLAAISFDFGSTLLDWLERAAPQTYAAVLAADQESVERYGGCGSAVAMPYHHLILPLASRRDKVTEVRWGIADFRRRFRRDPVGMWLPETAVDEETLEVLAAAGIRFTVLAPHQVDGAPPGGLPGRFRTGGGRTIALFTYDGAISQGVAFGGLLHDARAWAERLIAPDASGARRALVAVATDGETFGHHHRFGEVALAWLLHHLEARRDVRVENFAAVLARHPAEMDVRLVGPSSWSCPHGVERWRSDCTCRLTPDPAGRPIRWRAALRDALDWLAAELHGVFERESAGLLDRPWQAREDYAMAAGDRSAMKRITRGKDPVRAAELLELEWHALQMFTSCGWFFDDIAGIEAQQVLRYAARAVELAGPDADRLETGLLDRLARAESTTPGVGTGRDLYLASVKTKIPAPLRVAAGAAAAHRLAPHAETGDDPGYDVRRRGNRVILRRRRTGRETECRVALERTGTIGVSVAVTPVDRTRAARLGLDDLPERYRLPVAAALRAAVVARRLSSAERAQLAAGSADVSRLAAAALSRAVAALARDRSPSALAAVIELADLLALQGLHVPFDAQTIFARVREKVGAKGAAVLAPVARRLGFADERERGRDE